MTLMLVLVISICLSCCAFSKSSLESVENVQDIVECVFAIKVNSTITVSQQNTHGLPISKQFLQNIGAIDVEARSFSKKAIVKPGHKKQFIFPVTIFNKNTGKENRAIVYASNCDKNNKYYTYNPDDRYDTNKILRRAFDLGVKYIPRDHKVKALIRAFWPDNRKNVWEQIYAIIKDLLDVRTQEIISTILKEDIKSIKEEMITLYHLTKNGSDLVEQYKYVIEKLADIENRFILDDNNMFNFYLLPLYSNVVTLKLYFYNIGLYNHASYSETFHTICDCVKKQLCSSFLLTRVIAERALNEIYNTVYPGALYNVIMNARSHFAWHILEMFPKWINVRWKCDRYVMTTRLYQFNPISYSNFYGRVTPNLLEQAINIQYSPLVAEYMKTDGTLMFLNSIDIYIIKSEELQTVYGVELSFLSDISYELHHKFCFGTCKDGDNVTHKTLDLFLRRIIKLKVYKNTYIRCLEFTLSDKKTHSFGNDCYTNSTNFQFYLKDYYIMSLYLANDFPKTNKYLDNVAVSFLPNLFKYF